MQRLFSSPFLIFKLFRNNNVKEFVQPKMSLNNREFLILKVRGTGVGSRKREGRAGGRASQQAGIFKIRLGLEEMEIQRDREI
jgi:hypothetical protein